MTNALSRREALRRMIAGAAVGGAVTAPVHAEETSAKPAAPAAASQEPGVCVLFPEAIEGPYYFDPKLVRTDITEGRPGLLLDLTLSVIEAGPCTPLTNARIDVWHADAGGIYSGYAGQGDRRDVSAKGATYLRGTQITGADGTARFQSVYPGWYPGRTPHIHVKVLLDTSSLVTGQIYFPDALSARIYKEHAPYNARPVADTSNETDFLFKDGAREGGGIVLAASLENGRVAARLVIAVDRSGQAARRAEGWGHWIARTLGLRSE